MVESLILVALGFLIASLFALVGLQFVWRRAVTQTTRRLGLDVKTYSDAEAFTKAGRAIPDLEMALSQREQELSVLAERNANLAEAYDTALREAAPLRDDLAAAQDAHNAALIESQNLRNEIDSLYMRLSQAEALAAERTGKLQSLQQQMGEFESVIATEQNRQLEAGQQLKRLGDKAASINAELNEAIATGTASTWNQAAPALPPVAPEVPATIQLGEKEREDFDAVLPPVKPEEVAEIDLSERIEALENTAPH